MNAKAFSVEISARSVTFTFFQPVPGAEYLQPAEQFRIPLANWRALVANKNLEPGRGCYCNFTPAQLVAHGVAEVVP